MPTPLKISGSDAVEVVTGTEENNASFKTSAEIIRNVFGKKESNDVDSIDAVIGPMRGLNAQKLFEIFSIALPEERNKKWNEFFNSPAFQKFTPEEQKKMREIAENKENMAFLTEYIAGLMALPLVRAQKNLNPDIFKNMSIKDLESFIITHSKDSIVDDAENIFSVDDKLENNENQEFGWQPVATFVDGKINLIGKDEKFRPIDYNNLPPEFKKQLDKMEMDHKRFDNYLTLIQALNTSKADAAIANLFAGKLSPD